MGGKTASCMSPVPPDTCIRAMKITVAAIPIQPDVHFAACCEERLCKFAAQCDAGQTVINGEKVNFDPGYHSRQYCLRTCTDVCADQAEASERSGR